MPVLKNHMCEKCSRKRKWTASNANHGYYCEQCLLDARREEVDALAEVRSAKAKEKTECQTN